MQNNRGVIDVMAILFVGDKLSGTSQISFRTTSESNRRSEKVTKLKLESAGCSSLRLGQLHKTVYYGNRCN